MVIINNKEIILCDSFAGIGSLHKAIKKLGVNVKLGSMLEVDADAIISYGAVHDINISNVKQETIENMKKYLIDRNIGYDFKKQKSSIPRMNKLKLELLYKTCIATNNYGDISKVEPNDIEDFDLFNFSFPCTDISIAGLQQGMTDEKGGITRSGLYIYGMNIIKNKKPKYIMIENVKALIEKKFISDFYDIVKELEDIGYVCHYPRKDSGNPSCLNAKNYGVAQNRDRIFVICIRKDIDDGEFKFPVGFDNGLRLKDFLEEKVDEKYYINKAINFKFKDKYIQYDNNSKNHDSAAQRLYYNDGFMGSLISSNKGGDKTQIVEASKSEIIEIGKLEIKGQDKVVRVYLENGLCPTIDTMQGGNRQPKIFNNYKIRKLTPKECWRLMGFEDEDIDKCIKLRMSNSQLYKQAGNSIVVDVLYYIFKNLLKDYI